MNLHQLLDVAYNEGRLRALLDSGADCEQREGELQETALHVATRRRRLDAVKILLDHGAQIDARNAAGKTAWAHAARRRFVEVADHLAARGADQTLTEADRFAVAVVDGEADEARRILAAHPGVARTGNPEEDRLLADVAGRNPAWPVELLIAAGADLAAPALDDGTPLHQAAWFGQPQNARLLVEAGAPLDRFDRVHGYSPIGWAAHGSGASGGAEERQDQYVELMWLFLKAGASLCYPHDPGGRAYIESMLAEASGAVQSVLLEHLEAGA